MKPLVIVLGCMIAVLVISDTEASYYQKYYEDPIEQESTVEQSTLGIISNTTKFNPSTSSSSLSSSTTTETTKQTTKISTSKTEEKKCSETFFTESILDNTNLVELPANETENKEIITNETTFINPKLEKADSTETIISDLSALKSNDANLTEIIQNEKVLSESVTNVTVPLESVTNVTNIAESVTNVTVPLESVTYVTAITESVTNETISSELVTLGSTSESVTNETIPLELSENEFIPTESVTDETISSESITNEPNESEQIPTASKPTVSFSNKREVGYSRY